MKPPFLVSCLLCLALIPCRAFLLQPQRFSRLVPLQYSNRSDPSFEKDRRPSSDSEASNKLDLKWNIRNLFKNEGLAQNYLQGIYKTAQDSPTAQDLPPPNKNVQPSLPNPELEKVRMFLKSYSNDMGHAGRFGVEKNDQHSLQANLVFAMDQPLSYLQETLSCGPKTKKSKDEVVVFCPGLHTSLSESIRQQQYISKVLDGMPLSLLHLGSHSERVEVKLSADTLLALRKLDVMVDPSESTIEDGLYKLNREELDLLRAVLAWQPDAQLEDPLVESLVKLVDIAVESARTEQQEPPLALVAYSATANAIATALERWTQVATGSNAQLRNSNLGVSKAQALLRRSVTVVTIGGLCPKYPRGPAYVHVSMYDDKLATELGAKREEGDDAVHLQALSPYDTTLDETSLVANDPHNPQASAIQFLSLVMRTNGMRSFRQLYEAGSKVTPKLDISPQLFALNYYSNKAGELDLPSDDLLTSMIRATGGDRWLEHPLDEDDDVLPDALNAEATIAEHFGYGVYEEIFEACCEERALENDNILS